MSKIKTIKCDPGLLQMKVIARAAGAVYMRLPPDLQRDCGGCSCDYCKVHPDEKPMWDTLAVPIENLMRTPSLDWSWTLHMPDPQRFLAVVKKQEAERRLSGK